MAESSLFDRSAFHQGHENALQRAPRCATVRDGYYTIPSSIFSARSNFLELFIFLAEQIFRHLCISVAVVWPPRSPRLPVASVREDPQLPGTTGDLGTKTGGCYKPSHCFPHLPLAWEAPRRAPRPRAPPQANLLHGHNFLH